MLELSILQLPMANICLFHPGNENILHLASTSINTSMPKIYYPQLDSLMEELQTHHWRSMLKLVRWGSTLSNATTNHRLVGSLIYLRMTRPNIAYVVQVGSQFVSNPHKNHLTAVHHILHYIRGTTHKGLFYSSSSPLHL